MGEGRLAVFELTQRNYHVVLAERGCILSSFKSSDICLGLRGQKLFESYNICNERPGNILQLTAVVHEALSKTKRMRQVLI